jgi:hypothetical protein
MIAVAVVLAACGGGATATPQAPAPVSSTVATVAPEPFLLTKLYPASTIAGQAFNAQLDGSAALSVNAQGALAGTVIIFGGVELDTVYGKDVLTALVPADLYANPGTLEVFLRYQGTESNRLPFVVQPG